MSLTLPEMPEDIARILRAHQVTPSRQLLRALENGEAEWGYPGAVDLSEVGVGKSYMDSAAALATGRQPITLCPSVGVAGWQRAFQVFGREPRFVGTYEAVRGGWRPQIGEFKGAYFHWKDPSNAVLILDEAQMVKGKESMTTAAVGGAIIQRIPIIAASATLAATPLDMRIAGRITGLHTGGADWKRFLAETGCWYDEKEGRWKWDSRRRDVLEEINGLWIPARGCRLTKAETGPQAGSTLRPLPLDCDDADSINADWADLQDKLKHMEHATDPQGRKRFPREVITATRRAGRMKNWKRTEIALVPAVAERVRQCVQEGKSVVVFFSFTEARERMGKLLKTRAGFYGGQSLKQRQRIEADFQAGRERILLCNIGAGGASVSLHDLTGEFPRETFIFPTDNPVKMGQAPGRVDRDGGLTHSLQWIPHIRGGLMEQMIKSTLRKLSQMKALNDGAPQRRLFYPNTKAA